jgi:hypothetical protein
MLNSVLTWRDHSETGWSFKRSSSRSEHHSRLISSPLSCSSTLQCQASHPNTGICSAGTTENGSWSEIVWVANPFLTQLSKCVWGNKLPTGFVLGKHSCHLVPRRFSLAVLLHITSTWLSLPVQVPTSQQLKFLYFQQPLPIRDRRFIAVITADPHVAS